MKTTPSLWAVIEARASEFLDEFPSSSMVFLE
jgi:hypothetical protein